MPKTPSELKSSRQSTNQRLGLAREGDSPPRSVHAPWMRSLASLAPSVLLWQGSSPAKADMATTQVRFAERIAEDTWLRLKQSRKYRVRLGEETLTDILVLGLAGWTNGGRLQLYQPTKSEESFRGTDLEIYVRTGSTSAVHLAIQAKKLGRSGRYDHLGARVGQTGILQIDRLEAHGTSNKRYPTLSIVQRCRCISDQRLLALLSTAVRGTAIWLHFSA